jgi:hypothetical protein
MKSDSTNDDSLPGEHRGGIQPDPSRDIRALAERVEKVTLETSAGRTTADSLPLERLQKQLSRMDDRAHTQSQCIGDDQVADSVFANEFLDIFTGKAFHEQVDHLRKSEGESMSADDIATLAQSIRSFGQGVSLEDRQFIRDSSHS